jgi:two-component system sensor kinase FixL
LRTLARRRSIAVAADYWGVIRARLTRRPTPASAARTPWSLRTYLMVAVLIALLPVTLVHGLLELQIALSVHERDGSARMAAAVAAARSFEHRLDILIGTAVAAVAAERQAETSDARRLPPGAAVLAAMRVDGAIWRRDGGDFRPDPISGDPAADIAAPSRAERAAIVAGLVASGEPRAILAARIVPGQAARLLVISRQAALPPDIAALQLDLSSDRVGDLLSNRDMVDGWGIELVGPHDEVVGGTGTVARGRTRDGADTSLATAPLEEFPGWRIAVAAPGTTDTPRRLLPPAEMACAVIGSVLLGCGTMVWIGTRLTRALGSLTAEFSMVASSGELPPLVGVASRIRELDELRSGLVRSTAVLRRRAAAERMALTEARTGHELLASVVAATEDLIYVKNLELRVLLANRATLCVGGIDREEWQVLGRFIGEILPPETAEQEEALDRRVLASGQSTSVFLDWPDAAGVTRSFKLTKSPWRDTSRRITGVVTVAHEVTRERAAEARLASVQAELLRASRLSAMGAMASGLAHELNQPLAAATNFLNAAVRLLGATADDSGGPQARASRMARGATADAAEQMLRAGDIVRRLRAFIGRGEAALQPEDLGDVIREACALASADGAARGARLVVLESGMGELALLDRTQMQQVLLNLIRNAAEAIAGDPARPSPERTTSEDPKIEIACIRAADGAVRITVADNGPGIDAEVLPRLFEPFVSSKRDGIGIGLAICRTIVEGHGGRLSAQPLAAGGTMFVIVLPAIDAYRETGTIHGA